MLNKSHQAWRKLQTRRYRRRALLAIANSAYSLVSPFVNVIVSLLVIRLASVELWGAFIEIMILVQLGVQIISWGNKEFLLRAFSRTPRAVPAIWQSSLVTRMLLLAPLAVLAYFLIPRPLLGLALLLIGALALYRSFDVLVLYRRDFTFALVIEIVGSLAVLGMILRAGAAITVEELLRIYAGVALLKIIAMVVRRRAVILLWRVSWYWRYFALALPFFLLSLSGMLQSRIDLYSVSFYLDAQDVGVYQVLINLLIYLQALANLFILPFVRSLYRMDYAVFTRTARRLFTLGLIIIAPAMLIIYLLLTKVYQFQIPASLMVLGALYVLPVYFYSPIVYALFKAERQAIVTIISFSGAGVNLILNILLLPRLGLAGALVASVIAHWLAFLVYLQQSRALRVAQPSS